MLSRCTDCTDLEKTMSSQDERYPIPEHDKRSLGCGLDDDIEVAYAYVESVSDTHDIPSPAGWRGWALREEFLAGISYADTGKQAAEVELCCLNCEKTNSDAGGFLRLYFLPLIYPFLHQPISPG